MSSAGRIGLALGAVVVLVLAFVLLSPGGDDAATTPSATVPATTPDLPAGKAPQTATVATPPRPAPAFETIRVRGGNPVGGVKTITVKKGERARIEVSSPDTSDEIHVHGYDRYADVAPGRAARVSFEANAEGIFEIELHGTGTQIAKLAVEP